MERRIIDTHVASIVDEKLEVAAVGPAGPGGAHFLYSISGAPVECKLAFHTGDPSLGVTGITNESLLAIVIDRLRGFDEGPFRSRENSMALTKLQEGLLWLQCRTRERRARGVEGAHTP